jgi:threonine aldolase
MVDGDLMKSPVDLRSDTVTRPTPAMRRAIADAVVGDDVIGDDPTTIELERRVALLCDKQAALFVPSGTMGNQLGIAVHTRPGDQVLIERESHIFHYEQAGIGAISGCMANTVVTERGAITPAMLEENLEDPSDDHIARLSLVCMENTHNRHGGAIVPLEALRAVSSAARTHDVRVHLDGARLWNASVATGVPIREWAATADTLTMCFSKGLGAPVGSVFVGDEATVRRARRLRKRWGGGMRQVGILAAACLHALDHHLDRLADDHRRARELASRWRAMSGVRVAEPDTNIVFLDLEHPALDLQAVYAGLESRGILTLPYGPRRLRATTHLDVDDEGVARAAAALKQTLEEQVASRA